MELQEPKTDIRPLHRLHSSGRIALEAAQQIIGVTARPAYERDTEGVRGLAALVLHTAHRKRYSWSDVALAIWGRRKHSTAYMAAQKWKWELQFYEARDIYYQLKNKQET